MTDEKARYYSEGEVVSAYEHNRFGRGGGCFVAETERRVVADLVRRASLPQGALGLDCPAGTGRFCQLLGELGVRSLGADISMPMLRHTRRATNTPVFRADAWSLPLAPQSLDLWLMSRFCFHFSDLGALFAEAARVLKPGGWCVFDTYRWTPRSWIPGSQSYLGGRVHVHRADQIVSWLAAARLRVVHVVPVFLFTPFLYGFAPERAVRLLEQASDRLAPNWKTKQYWAAQLI
jgi:SAM-dependent methyltransferase